MPHLFGVGPNQILVVGAYCISRLGITSLLTKSGRAVTIVEATCIEGAFDKLAQEEFAAAFLPPGAFFEPVCPLVYKFAEAANCNGGGGHISPSFPGRL